MRPSPLSWRGQLYIGAVFVAGMAAVAASGEAMRSGTMGYEWLLLAVLTWVSGPFAIKVPTISATISVSEAFVFTSILLYGPAPATLTVAIDGLFTSLYRRNMAPRRILFNTSEPAISAFLAGHLFFFAAGVPPLAQAEGHMVELFLPVLLLGTASFLLNSGLTAVAVWLETGASPVHVWRTHFLWLSVNYFAGASIAILLAVNMRIVTLGSLIAILPLLAILYLTFQSWSRRLEDSNRHIEELNGLYMATVESLATAVDAKDQVTHGHIRRVQTFSLRLARTIGITDELELKAIEAAALLHDMGKLAIPDYILNKPGKLTASEYSKMKMHAAAGAEILAAVDFPYPVVPIVRHHHEAWDGSGYPDGLAGCDIPIGARVLSVIDCYDALTSDRPYRPAMTPEQALDIIRDNAGRMYDPMVVNALAEHREAICAPIDLSGVPQNTVIQQIIEACREPWEQADTASDASGANLGQVVVDLCDVADVAAGRASLGQVAELTARHLRRLAPAALVGIYLIDDDAQQLVLAHASGFGEDRLSGLRIDIGEGLSGWVAANGTSMVDSHPRLDLGSRIDGLEPPLQTSLAVALRDGDRTVGALALYATTAGAFDPKHTHVVEVVARQIAPAIYQAATLVDVGESALRDPQTGLPNAAHLERLCRSPGFSSSQMMRALGVLRVSFRPTTPGEASIGELAHGVAALTTGAVRVADMVFRGGEHEVVVLMPDSDASAGALVESRIVDGARATASNARLEVGFACAPLDGDTLSVLLETAARRCRPVEVAGVDEPRAALVAGGRR